jgi:hypothetical protein
MASNKRSEFAGEKNVLCFLTLKILWFEEDYGVKEQSRKREKQCWNISLQNQWQNLDYENY